MKYYILIFILLFSSQISSFEKSDDFISFEEIMNRKISTASKYEKNISDIPASVTIITYEDIQNYGYLSLAEALNSISGFYLSYDRNYHYLGTRGFSRPTDYNNRIKLLLDGHSLNENYYGSIGIGDDLIIDLEAVERIEVIKGPGSALYGTGAMFSVINVITKKADLFEGLQITGHVGSFKSYRTSGIFNKKFTPKFKMSFSGIWGDTKGEDLYFSEFDDPSTNNGIAESLDGSSYEGLRAIVELGDFTFRGSIANNTKHVPTASWEVDFNHPATNTKDELKTFKVSYEYEISKNIDLDISGNYNDYYYEAYYPYDDFLELEKNWGEWYGGEGQLIWDLHSTDKLNLGFEYQKNSKAKYAYSGEDGESYFTSDNPNDIISLYLQNEYKITNDLALTLGMRFDDYSISESSTSPRAAIVFHQSDETTFKILYGKALRAPSLYETYYNDTATGFFGNLDLQVENITTYEFIIEHFLNNSTFAKVSVFNYEMENLIDYVENPIDLTFKSQNRGNVKAKGFEAEIRAQYFDGVSWYANYTYEHAKESVRDVKLSNSPTHLLKAGISYPLHEQVSIATDIRYESERKTVYDTKTDAHFISNLNIFFKPKLNNRHSLASILNRMKMSFKIRNIFDTEYSNPGGYEHIQDQIIQPGRTFLFTTSYLF